MATYTVRPNQTFADVVINTAGTMEAAMKIAAANDIAITDILYVGQVIIIPETVTDTEVLKYLTANDIVVATKGDQSTEGVFLTEDMSEVFTTESGEPFVRE